MYPPQINGVYVLSIHLNQWNESDFDCGWEVKLMLCNVVVTQVLLYGVEGWHDSSQYMEWDWKQYMEWDLWELSSYVMQYTLRKGK